MRGPDWSEVQAGAAIALGGVCLCGAGLGLLVVGVVCAGAGLLPRTVRPRLSASEYVNNALRKVAA